MYNISGNFRIDISKFENLARHVGYLNHKLNVNPDDRETQSQYETLRLEQIRFQEELIKEYSKKEK